MDPVGLGEVADHRAADQLVGDHHHLLLQGQKPHRPPVDIDHLDRLHGLEQARRRSWGGDRLPGYRQGGVQQPPAPQPRLGVLAQGHRLEVVRVREAMLHHLRHQHRTCGTVLAEPMGALHRFAPDVVDHLRLADDAGDDVTGVDAEPRCKRRAMAAGKTLRSSR